MKPKEVHFANFAACRASFLLIATTCFPYPLASTMPPHVFEQCCSRAPAHVIPLRPVNLQIGCVSRNNCFNTWPHWAPPRVVFSKVGCHHSEPPCLGGSAKGWLRRGQRLALKAAVTPQQSATNLVGKRRTIKKNRRWFGNSGWFLWCAVWRCGR